MCGGRGENKGREEEEEGGGGRGHREVLAGAGRRGGGEERVGDLFLGAAGVEVVLRSPCFSSSTSSLVSMMAGSGAAAGVSATLLVNALVVAAVGTSVSPLCVALAGRRLPMVSRDFVVSIWGGLF